VEGRDGSKDVVDAGGMPVSVKGWESRGDEGGTRGGVAGRDKWVLAVVEGHRPEPPSSWPR
jgi:hypothetical protein